jgi:hypothetical protein
MQKYTEHEEEFEKQSSEQDPLLQECRRLRDELEQYKTKEKVEKKVSITKNRLTITVTGPPEELVAIANRLLNPALDFPQQPLQPPAYKPEPGVPAWSYEPTYTTSTGTATDPVQEPEKEGVPQSVIESYPDGSLKLGRLGNEDAPPPPSAGPSMPMPHGFFPDNFHKPTSGVKVINDSNFKEALEL